MPYCWKLINTADEAWGEWGAQRSKSIKTHKLGRRGGVSEACSNSLHLHRILSVLNWLLASPWGVKTGSMWVERDARSETSEIAARDVTLRQQAQTFFGWMKRLWPPNMMHAPQASCQLVSTLLFWKDFKVFFLCTLTSNSLSNLGPHAFQGGWKDFLKPYDIH